jgi:hypothetical protein
MEVFHDPFFTGLFAHQVGNWEVHNPNSISFSLALNMSQELKPGMLRRIIRDADLTVEDFIALLD